MAKYLKGNLAAYSERLGITFLDSIPFNKHYEKNNHICTNIHEKRFIIMLFKIPKLRNINE